MNPKSFGADSPGQLLRISYPNDDLAFLPNLLPPELKLSDELVRLLIKAHRAVGELNGIGQTLDNPNLLLRRLQSRESLTSSGIEGTHVSPTQLLKYELNPVEPGSSKEQDSNEVYNYQRSLMLGSDSLNSYPLGSHLLQALHAELMKGVRGMDKLPGRYRISHVQFGSDARYVPPPAEHVQQLMDQLFEYSETDQQTDPLIKAFLIHYQFESIHPFTDGNGRVGRLLLSLMIAKWLGHTQPWLFMSAYFEEYKEEYVEKMFAISSQGKWTDWLEFCLRGTEQQAKDSIKRCKRFHNLRSDFFARVQGKSKYSNEIIDMLFHQPGLHIQDLADKYGIAYNTAKKNVRIFVDAKILKEEPDNHPKLYVADEILKVANARLLDL